MSKPPPAGVAAYSLDIVHVVVGDGGGRGRGRRWRGGAQGDRQQGHGGLQGWADRGSVLHTTRPGLRNAVGWLHLGCGTPPSALQLRNTRTPQHGPVGAGGHGAGRRASLDEARWVDAVARAEPWCGGHASSMDPASPLACAACSPLRRPAFEAPAGGTGGTATDGSARGNPGDGTGGDSTEVQGIVSCRSPPWMGAHRESAVAGACPRSHRRRRAGHLPGRPRRLRNCGHRHHPEARPALWISPTGPSRRRLRAHSLVDVDNPDRFQHPASPAAETAVRCAHCTSPRAPTGFGPRRRQRLAP